MDIKFLKENPYNKKIYGIEIDDDSLKNSIKINGVLVPITIKKDGTIISGHRRYRACKSLNMNEIPTVYIDIEDELQEKEMIINFNKQREKTYSQKYNEVKELEEIEKEKALRRKYKSVPQTFVEGSKDLEKGEVKKILAEKTGFGSGENLRKYEKIKEAKKPDLIEKLDKNEITINKAFQEIKKDERKKKIEERIKESENKKMPINIKLLEGDLFDKIKEVDDESIDLLCTDPPYFVLNEDWDEFENKMVFLKFTADWLKAVIPKVKLKTGRIYISFAFDYMFDLYNILLENNFFGFIFYGALIWVKKNNTAPFDRKGYRFNYEPIFYLYGKDVDKLEFLEFNEIQQNVWDIATPQTNFTEGKFHPAQKPFELYRRIITTGSKVNDTILDCFAGSGTTGIVCKNLNRNCILIERDKKYIEIIKQRVKMV